MLKVLVNWVTVSKGLEVGECRRRINAENWVDDLMRTIPEGSGLETTKWRTDSVILVIVTDQETEEPAFYSGLFYPFSNVEELIVHENGYHIYLFTMQSSFRSLPRPSRETQNLLVIFSPSSLLTSSPPPLNLSWSPRQSSLHRDGSLYCGASSRCRDCCY